ncbi:MAG TPA: hypothetical protein VHM00_06375 [Caldimonas sp.]|jgi:hypothetical protein|nr:hypothetical protein [Caldimonas sp.]HEX2540691.1 hypothetical protein [Caldimonas sp.]
MKRFLAAALAASAAAAAMAQPQVGVSVSINQPGVYGRVHIGDVPRPALVLPQPVVVSQPRVVVRRDPVYLYVPPTHQQNWRRYCGRYEACGQPVYFVRDDWVRERYEREHPGWDRGRHRGWDRDHDRGRGRGHDKQKHKHKHDRRD